MLRSCLYRCRVRHHRREPREYRFSSTLFQFLLDLDEIDELARRLPLLSRNRFNAYSFHDADHLDLGQGGVRANLLEYLRREGVTEPVGRVRLLTSLRTFGHVFNPVSYFFVEDSRGDSLAVVAEVNNTFGETKPYLVSRADREGDWFKAAHRKRFYISPFSELDHELVLRFRFPDERLNLHVSGAWPGRKPFFHASLTGWRRELTLGQLAWYSLRFPFVSLKVVFLIHWHALFLWLKGVPFHRKSHHPEKQTGMLNAVETSSKI